MLNRVLLLLSVGVLFISSCSGSGLNGGLDSSQTDIPTKTVSVTDLPTVSTPMGTTIIPSTNSAGEMLPPSPTAVAQLGTPTPVVSPGPVYQLQAGTPLELKNFIDLNAGCNWMGIGGQVFDLDGSPLKEFIIEVGGYMGGREVLQMGITGDTPSLGPGGYSIKLSDYPLTTEKSLWLQLFGLNGNPMSEMVYFSTHQDCDKNFILINLVEIPPGYGLQAVLPLILKNTPIP
jgi:hypothetical protein